MSFSRKKQSAYRRFHSCESALLTLVNDLLHGMENHEVTALIAIDHAALDTVVHGILIDLLHTQYGVCDVALDWVDSYLRPRSCCLKVNQTESSQRDITCRVPSYLGPWLYLTYAGTIFDIVPPSISVYGFADDHTASICFRPSSAGEEQSAIACLQECAVTINDWMSAKKLKMNASKTKFVLFGSRHQPIKCSTKEILVCDDSIEIQNCIRYLGAFLDDNLEFKDHIKRKYQSAMSNVFKIKSIRRYLTREATYVSCQSLVISHLDYCNVILYGIS